MASNLYEIQSEVRVQAGWYFPVRCTVIRLSDGGLWVHSPVALDDPMAEEVTRLGPVKHLVAPNNLHHLFIGQWKERFSEARLTGARGLRKKRPDLSFDHWLGDPESSWTGIEQIFLEGVPSLCETVFYHDHSKTLVATDLFFNLHPEQLRGPLTPWILRMVGAYGHPAQSRLFRMLTSDRARAGDSVERMLKWPFVRILVAHGASVSGDAASTLRSACRWMLDGRSAETPKD